MPRIFRTKLLLPTLFDVIARPRLLGGPIPRVLFAQAPAGAGKTVFLTQWAAACGCTTVYYRLDEQDQAPAVFAAHVLAGLRTVWPDWNPPAEAGDEPETLAVELVNEAAARPPLLLVLDQLEAAFGRAYLSDFLALVVRYAPPGLHLVLGSRAPLPGDLAGPGRPLRLVTALDLAMTEAEAEAWLGQGNPGDCLSASGGFPLALHLWKQVGAGWREALAAHALAAAPPHLPADVARALVAGWLGGTLDLATYAHQMSTGQPGAEAFWGEVRAIRLQLLAGELSQARGALQPLWEQTRASGDRPLMGAVALLTGEYHYCRGEYGQAMEWYRQAFEADSLLETVGTHSKVAILKDQGHEEEAEVLALRCLAARQSRGDLQALAYAHAQYGSVLTGLGRFEEAERHLAEAERLGLRLSGEPFYGILALAYRAVLKQHEGNAAAYRQLAEEAYALAKTRSPWLEAICGYILAFALLQWGEVEAGRRLLGQALAYLSGIDSKWQLHMVHFYVARGLWARGQTDEARRHVDTSLTLAAREGYVQFLSSRRADAAPQLIDALLRGVEVPLCQELLVRMGQRAVPALLELAASPDPEARRSALYPLARIGSEEAVTAVRHLLYDPAEMVQNAALMALRSLGQSPVAEQSPAVMETSGETAARLSVAVLGTVSVSAAGQAVQNWRTTKARDLLAFLALNAARPVTRDQLLEALWPEADPEAAQASLHTALYQLRRALKPAGENLIAFAGGAYRLERAGLEIDLERFDRLAAQGDMESWKAAATLYRGDLLDGLEYTWCEGARAAARTTYLRVLRSLAGALRTRGEHELAIDWLQRLVQADPLAEEGHVGLMECFHAIGNRNAALQQYRTLSRLLDEELGLAPSREAQRVYRLLLD